MSDFSAHMSRSHARRRPLKPLDERFAFTGDGARMELRPALRPVLYEVEDREAGGEFCLKLWRKTGTSADAELRELWRHEMRHVQRVMSHGSALGFVVNIVEFVEDDSDFGVLMERAGRPLNHLMSRANQKHWLRQLSISAHRARFWRNVRRLVVALGAVHAQGLVHGAINEEACFTEGGTRTGF